jgi:predicted component of type VI protein secretion system
MKLNLVVLTPGKTEGKAIPITLSQFLIGRDPQCQLRPASASISKRHCAILIRNGKVFVQDFGSTNGTFTNDQPVKGEAELHHDDRLKVGPLLFGLRIEDATGALNETPPPATRATPPPPTKAPAQAAGKAKAAPKAPPAEDDEAAAMLLAMQDDEGTTPTVESSIPDGSTVIMVPGMVAEEQAQTDEPAKGGEPLSKGPGKAPPITTTREDTSNVARAILQKYMRRPRA